MEEMELRIQRCCFTGHRPEKLHCGEEIVRAKLAREIDRAIAEGYRTFISGMARGVDIWAAEIVLERRKENPALRLICALPYPGFGDRWGKEWKGRYQAILAEADLEKAVCPSFFMGSYQKRNEWMVDHAGRVIAVYDGEAGGTRNTILYAQKRKVEVRILSSDDQAD